MNREILFRGKHMHVLPQNEHLDGTWVYGYLADENYINSPELEGELVVDPETVCQYTGLTDKNGRKIFEGDIVRTNSGRLCKVVWFSSPQYQGWDLVPVEAKNPAPKEWNLWEDLEIIGNIFDNPELLKE